MNLAFPPRFVIVADLGMAAICLSIFSSSNCFFLVSILGLPVLLGFELKFLCKAAWKRLLPLR